MQGNHEYYYAMANVPEWVLDNLDTLGLHATDLQVADIVNYTRRLDGRRISHSVIRQTIEGYRLPDPKSYNVIADFYGWQKWEA